MQVQVDTSLKPVMSKLRELGLGTLNPTRSELISTKHWTGLRDGRGSEASSLEKPYPLEGFGLTSTKAVASLTSWSRMVSSVRV